MEIQNESITRKYQNDRRKTKTFKRVSSYTYYSFT